VNFVANPYRRQVAGAVLHRKLLRIAPIGLDALARLARVNDGATTMQP
jgi:hypothetical protein